MNLQDASSGRDACAFCPKLCRHACPVALAEGTEQATPTFKQQVARDAASGRRPLDAQRARALFQCADCGAASEACRHRVDVAASLRQARAEAVRSGHAPAEVQGLIERFAADGSPYPGAELRAAADAAEAAAGPCPPGTPVTLLAGCSTLARAPGEVTAALRVLRRLGEPAVLARPDPACCGTPLFAAGLTEAFAAHARRFAASAGAGARLLCLSPGCARTLAAGYREVGVTPPRALPWVDRLVQLTVPLGLLAAPRRDDTPVAYHDPCQLGRRLRRFSEPRAALRAALGRAPVELGYAREDALCAGGGGLYPLTHPDGARRCAERVLALLAEGPASTLVSGCPDAARRLARAAPPGVRVLGLAAFLDHRLRG